MSVEIPVRGSYPVRPFARTEAQGVWSHPDMLGLVWTLIRTDFKIRYHGSMGGFVWALARPLSMFLALMGVFSFVFAAQPNYLLNLVLGLFLYEFFAEGTRFGLQSLLAKGFLLTKTRFPYWIIVAISSVNAVIALLIFITVLLVYFAFSGNFPGPLGLGLFLSYVAQMWLIILGFSLALSPLYVRYHDLDHLWGSATQVGFFLAPVIFPLAMIPEHIHRYLFLWPPTPVIVYSRAVLIEGRIPTVGEHMYLLGMTLTVLGVGMLLFRRYSRRAAEFL